MLVAHECGKQENDPKLLLPYASSQCGTEPTTLNLTESKSGLIKKKTVREFSPQKQLGSCFSLHDSTSH